MIHESQKKVRPVVGESEQIDQNLAQAVLLRSARETASANNETPTDEVDDTNKNQSFRAFRFDFSTVKMGKMAWPEGNS
jgi:hypothetical protein